MIPQDYITAWSRVAPWASQRQVEQDLIISRALVTIFSDPFLRGELRFRGGTALNKLHFPAPLRYSEDIDLVRTTAGPIRPLLDRLHDVLDPWLGKPRFDQSPVAPKLKYTVEAEDRDSPSPIRLKIEINTREREAYDSPIEIPFGVENPWFAGEAAIPAFSREEMLATKLRALLQRNNVECLLPFRGPKRPCVFTLLVFELVGHPEQRAVDHGAIIASEVHDPGFDDEAAEFDQMARPLAAFDLPGAHVMPRPRSLMPVARCPVAAERHQRRGQAPMQIAATVPERTRPRVSPMPPSFRHLSSPPARSARPRVRRR